jgi:hypothetical protein
VSLGSVVIQPQRLARAQAAKDSDSVLADVAALAIGILRDTAGGGQILAQIEAAGIASGDRVVAHAQSGLAHARERLAALVETPIDRAVALARELGGVDDVDTALTGARDLLTAFSAGADALTIDHVRQYVGELLDIIENDLGLRPDFLEREIFALFDDIAERLEHVAPEPDAGLRSNRIQVIGALRRLRRRLDGLLEFPQLDPEHAADDLFEFIRSSGISDGAGRVACVGSNLAGATDAARRLLTAVPVTGFLSGSVGAAVVPDVQEGEEYLWYPSWLANNNRPPLVDILMLVPGDEVRRARDKSYIVQRNILHDSRLIASGTNLEWADHARLGDDAATYSFGSIDAGAMETIAFATAILQSVAEGILHLTSLEEGDYASNVVNAFGALVNSLWRGLEHEPTPWWLDGLLDRTVGTTLASLEGIHTKATAANCFSMWMTLLGPDLIEMLTWKYLTNLARDNLLSLLTLVNHEPPSGSAPAPRNRQEFDAIRHAVTLGIHNLFLLAFKRQNWGLMKAVPGGVDTGPLLELTLLWSLGVGTCVGILGGFVGSLLGQAIARDVSLDVFKRMWWSIPQVVLTTIYWLYLQNDGSTQNGRYTPFTGGAYKGYQPKDTSPYKMPFDPAAVSHCYVVQGNQGLWSHNFNNVGQVYAYDFSLDEGDEVLAARAGTVIQFSESVPNTENPVWTDHTSTLATAINAAVGPATIDVASGAVFAEQGWVVIGDDFGYYTSKSGNTLQGVTWKGGVTAAHAVGDTVTQTIFGWNFVVVKHDVDETGAALASPDAHDLGVGGTAITTLGVYGHGLPGSISAAFASHDPPVPTAEIVGTLVKQGMPIMAAGDTGISFNNHLHMHVVPDPGPNATTHDYRAYGGEGDTIPFVFSDGDAPANGVLRRLNFYTSSNARRTS